MHDLHSLLGIDEGNEKEMLDLLLPCMVPGDGPDW